MRERKQESELKEMARNIAKNITMRETGKRKSTNEESNIIGKIAYGALLSLDFGENMRSSKEMAQAAIDTAEFTLNLFLTNANGYATIYSPLQTALHEWKLQK